MSVNQINLPVVFKPVNFIQKEKTDILVCVTFNTLIDDIGIFIDFLVLEKKKTRMCSFDSCRSSILKNDQEKQPKKFDCSFIKFKTLLEYVVSTSTAKYILKSALVKKGKLKPDVNIISDLFQEEKYVDNNIHIFHLL